MVLPESAAGYGISVRRWRRADLDALHGAIVASAEHLRPWMEWAQDEPRSVEQHLCVLERWEDEWKRAADAHFAVCDERGNVVGHPAYIAATGAECSRSATGPGEQPDDRAAPAEVGIDCTWRISREAWLGRAN